MPIVFDENSPVFLPWSELGTARSEPAPQPCDKCGKVCEEIVPGRHRLCRACATEREATADHAERTTVSSSMARKLGG